MLPDFEIQKDTAADVQETNQLELKNGVEPDENLDQSKETENLGIDHSHLSTSGLRLAEMVRNEVLEVTELNDIPLSLPLYEAGLDSLSVIALLPRLNKMIPHGLPRLPNTLLFHYPTIVDIAILMDSLTQSAAEPATKQPKAANVVHDDKINCHSNSKGATMPPMEFPINMSPLVMVQRGRPSVCKKTVYLLPGACFSARCFVQLANMLGPEVPVYGFEDLTLYNLRPEWTSIEEIAIEFVRVLREHQPEGPYIVGGWSMGGVIGYEVMRQLLKVWILKEMFCCNEYLSYWLMKFM